MTVNVKTKLTLDTNAARELDNVKKGFRGTADAAKDAKSEAADFAKQVAAVAIGTHLPNMIKGTYDMAKGWLTAANAAYDQEQALAGLYATMRELPWQESREEAEKMRRSLLDMAAEIGQAPEEVYKGFQKLLMFVGDATEESFNKARQQTEQLTTLSNVMGMNVEQLAMEFGAMHDGVVRARGPLFQILKGTGIFGDNIAKATTEWRKLSDEARKELLSDALEKQAAKIGKATPTISDLINTFSNMKQLFIEEVGAPVIRALLPVLKDLKEQLKAARPQFEAFAQAIGKDLAQSVIDAAKWLKEAFVWISQNKELIRDRLFEAGKAIKDAFMTAKDVVKWIIDNKEVLMAIWAGSKVGGVGGAAAGLGAGLAMQQAGGMGAGEQALGTAGAAGGTAVAAALLGASASATAALAGLAAAAYQGAQLYEEQWGDMSDEALNALAKMERAQEEYNRGNLQKAKDWAQQAAAEGDKGREIASKMLAAIAAREAQEDKLRHQLNQALAETNLAQAIDVYNQAVLQGNTEMARMAAAQIKASDELAKSLEDGKVKIVGGMESLTKAAEEQFTDWQAAMDNMLSQIGEANDAMSKQLLGLGPRPKRVRFGGGEASKRKAKRRTAGRGGGGINVNKMEIKQEFRDQDPDRIAVVFRRDIVNAAVKRVQSRRATIFGI